MGACNSRVCPGKCNGHGVCRNGTCQCDDGYSGDDCLSLACPRGCSGHGICLAGKCLCKPGWEGAACESSGCPNDCSGHGVCNQSQPVKMGDLNGTTPSVEPSTDAGRFRCVCEPGFEGDDCGTAVCVNKCTDLKHGVCNKGTCVCNSGFGGVDCSVPVVGKETTHQCIVGCNTKCNSECGKQRATKGMAFYTKCLQDCMNPCKDSCKNKVSDPTDQKGHAFRSAQNATRPDLLHAQRNGGGPQPNEMRPQPEDEPVVDTGRTAPQRNANGAGPKDGLFSAAAKDINSAESAKMGASRGEVTAASL